MEETREVSAEDRGLPPEMEANDPLIQTLLRAARGRLTYDLNSALGHTRSNTSHIVECVEGLRAINDCEQAFGPSK